LITCHQLNLAATETMAQCHAVEQDGGMSITISTNLQKYILCFFSMDLLIIAVMVHHRGCQQMVDCL